MDRIENSKKLIRTFCAIKLPDEIRSQATDYVSNLDLAAPKCGVKWEKVENLHLTLKFIGEITEERLERLIQAAEHATSDSHSFELSIKGTGIFPPSGPARIVWLGVIDHTKELRELQSKLEKECEQEGFERETKAFHPHLTIGRVKEPRRAKELVKIHKEKSFESPIFTVDHLVVMKSELSRDGSSYTVLSRLNLKSNQ
jgi:RNA 2',3'-cyclic 3'-phosphodiesterase